MRSPSKYYLGLIPVDIACIVLGYLQAIAASIIIATAIVHYAIFANQLADGIDELRDDTESRIGRGLSVLGTVISASICIGVFLIMAFKIVMAVFLIIGVQKRNGCFVMSYFVCGVITNAMLLSGALYIFNEYGCFAVSVPMLVGGIVYALCLHMVYMVYNNINMESDTDEIGYKNLKV